MKNIVSILFALFCAAITAAALWLPIGDDVPSVCDSSIPQDIVDCYEAQLPPTWSVTLDPEQTHESQDLALDTARP